MLLPLSGILSLSSPTPGSLQASSRFQLRWHPQKGDLPYPETTLGLPSITPTAPVFPLSQHQSPEIISLSPHFLPPWNYLSCDCSITSTQHILQPSRYQLSSVQFSRSVVSDSATPWIAARQASLSITNSRISLRFNVHRVRDAIQPSHPLSFPSPPAPNSSQHQSLFQWVNSLHEVAKVLEFQLQPHSLQIFTKSMNFTKIFLRIPAL